MEKKIAIFASGTGSNAKKIIEYFLGNDQIRVDLVISNKGTAPVLAIAQSFGIDTMVIDRSSFYQSDIIVDQLKGRDIELLVLAGFLWLVPDYLVRAFPNQIVNIHPALLPKFGGKGMYGMNVHKAVKESGETETGITIHYVNEKYDDGKSIFQATCPVYDADTPEQIAKRVLQLEHENFPKVIEKVLLEAGNN
ncbi:MAG: phosphoribosylglycinamide formyltransferase [Saprospiraceae bacterium]|nr:phosphoribosylglycinamide formyltransferase [Saprospiraceae bacterium]